jgi:hypothetical protein
MLLLRGERRRAGNRNMSNPAGGAPTQASKVAKKEERLHEERNRDLDMEEARITGVCPKCGGRLGADGKCVKCHYSPGTAYASRPEAKDYTHEG